MKSVSLLIILVYLLLPLACFAYPCDSYLDSQDTADSSGKSGSHSNSQDADNCDSTTCCAEYTSKNALLNVIYQPLVSVNLPPKRYQKLPEVVIPIFVPPQSLT